MLDAACGSGYGVSVLAAAGATSVTGVDIDPDAVSLAQRDHGEQGTILPGDIRELPFPDDSFDLVVSWETIEHVEEGERAIAEFRRVLRDDGVLLISSPNPDVYPPGNEHHVREYRPDELRSLVSAHFPRTRLWGQQARLASEIAPLLDSGRPLPEAVHSISEIDRSQPTFGIVVAGAAELPRPQPEVAMASAFEVKWWSEQVAAARSEAKGRLGARAERIKQLGAPKASNGGGAPAREPTQAAGRASEVHEALVETSEALYAANQELAKLPLLQHRLAETEAREQALLEETRQIYENSRSWRLTRPVRYLTRLLQSRRRRKTA